MADILEEEEAADTADVAPTARVRILIAIVNCKFIQVSTNRGQAQSISSCWPSFINGACYFVIASRPLVVSALLSLGGFVLDRLG